MVPEANKVSMSLAFKLVNEIDVETTKQAIEKFSAENRDLIRINADRLVSFCFIISSQFGSPLSLDA